MFKWSTWLCLSILFGAVTPGCLAQSADTASREKERSPFVSGVLEWTVPMAGYVYAENIERGILPNVVRVGGLLLFIDGFGAGNINWPNPRGLSNALIGLGVGAVGSFWAITGAVIATQQRNARINRAGASLGLGLGANNGPTITLRIPL